MMKGDEKKLEICRRQCLRKILKAIRTIEGEWRRHGNYDETDLCK